MFKAIWKIFMNVITLGTYKANNTANDVLSSSADGIRAAYDKTKNDLINRHSTIVNAVAKIQSQKNKAENDLKALDVEEKELQSYIEGILQAIEKNPNDLEAIKDFESIENRQVDIDKIQEELSAEIGTLTIDIQEYKLSLNDIQNKVSKLTKEGDRAVADMELAKMREEIETEKAGLQKSVDMSGVDAIREKIANKKAMVETLKMSNGSNTEDRMRKYKAQASISGASDKLNDMLAKRESIKNAKTAGKGSSEKVSIEKVGVREV